MSINGINGNGRWYNKPLTILIINQMITFIVVFVSIAISNQQGSWKLDQKMTELFAWRVETDAQIRRMDREGTNYSHMTLNNEIASINSNTTRIEKLETAQRKIDVIDEKISRIEADVKDIKGRRP